MISAPLKSLLEYIEKEQFKGYDPYDTLLSPFQFKRLGKWAPVIATQIQKRNPLNIRPILGIRKALNPKGVGILLHAYSRLAISTNQNHFLDTANHLYSWLVQNYSKGYRGYCWGYNFPWASPSLYMQPFTPSSVVTAFVCKGIWNYIQASKNSAGAEIIKSAADFVKYDLKIFNNSSGVSISYTPLKMDVCYNASLLAGEILAMNYKLHGSLEDHKMATEIVDFVCAKQNIDGSWNYSYDLVNGTERKQIDFHQGYILDSIFEIGQLLDMENPRWKNALKLGAKFYFDSQFKKNGRSLWRYPREYPIDIHNQSQGIITFSKLQFLNAEYKTFSNTILKWTIKHMQARNGHFYYRIYRDYKIKISYMRWNNAWMLLALTYQDS